MQAFFLTFNSKNAKFTDMDSTGFDINSAEGKMWPKAKRALENKRGKKVSGLSSSKPYYQENLDQTIIYRAIEREQGIQSSEKCNWIPVAYMTQNEAKSRPYMIENFLDELTHYMNCDPKYDSIGIVTNQDVELFINMMLRITHNKMQEGKKLNSKNFSFKACQKQIKEMLKMEDSGLDAGSSELSATLRKFKAISHAIQKKSKGLFNTIQGRRYKSDSSKHEEKKQGVSSWRLCATMLSLNIKICKSIIKKPGNHFAYPMVNNIEADELRESPLYQSNQYDNRNSIYDSQILMQRTQDLSRQNNFFTGSSFGGKSDNPPPITREKL